MNCLRFLLFLLPLHLFSAVYVNDYQWLLFRKNGGDWELLLPYETLLLTDSTYHFINPSEESIITLDEAGQSEDDIYHWDSKKEEPLPPRFREFPEEVYSLFSPDLLVEFSWSWKPFPVMTGPESSPVFVEFETARFHSEWVGALNSIAGEYKLGCLYLVFSFKKIPDSLSSLAIDIRGDYNEVNNKLEISTEQLSGPLNDRMGRYEGWMIKTEKKVHILISGRSGSLSGGETIFVDMISKDDSKKEIYGIDTLFLGDIKGHPYGW